MQVLAVVGGIIMSSVKDANVSTWIFVKEPELLLGYWNCPQGAEEGLLASNKVKHLGYRPDSSSISPED